ncbi:acyl-CoA dehydrogenase family protein [Streptomyces sp. NPDC059916]
MAPRELFTGLGELGGLGIAVPEKSGSAEIHDFRYNVILEQLSKAVDQ